MGLKVSHSYRMAWLYSADSREIAYTFGVPTSALIERREDDGFLRFPAISQFGYAPEAWLLAFLVRNKRRAHIEHGSYRG